MADPHPLLEPGRCLAMPPVKPAKREEADQIERLIDALLDQTAAMRELAESNRQVVDMLLARHAEDEGGDSPAGSYLDGSPAR